MKKNINILLCVFLFNTFKAMNKEELAKFKKDAQEFSKSIDISKEKSGKKAQNNNSIKSKSFFGSFFGSKSKDDSELIDAKNKNNTKDIKPKKSFFSSLFGSKNKNDSPSIAHQDKKVNKKNQDTAQYEDPFGGLDENVFDAVGKTKKKSEEKQKKTDQKKINKKNGEEKAAAKKKDQGFFSSLGSSLKSGMKSLAKSDLGKQVGGVLKDATSSVLTNAITTGAEKLNEGVGALNSKISGKNNEEIVLKPQPINNIDEIVENKNGEEIEDTKIVNIDDEEVYNEEDIKSFSDKLDKINNNVIVNDHSGLIVSHPTSVHPTVSSSMQSNGRSKVSKSKKRKKNKKSNVSKQ